jgi:predicted DNA-binding transcriptional regulator AlpA
MKFILLFLLIPLCFYPQKIKLKLNLVEWRTGNLGNVIVDDTLYKVNIMWSDIIWDEKQDYVETMLFTSNHKILIQKTPTQYYKTIYYKNGKTECVEISRNWFYDWIIKTLVFP